MAVPHFGRLCDEYITVCRDLWRHIPKHTLRYMHVCLYIHTPTLPRLWNPGASLISSACKVSEVSVFHPSEHRNMNGKCVKVVIICAVVCRCKFASAGNFLCSSFSFLLLGQHHMVALHLLLAGLKLEKERPIDNAPRPKQAHTKVHWTWDCQLFLLQELKSILGKRSSRKGG